MSEKYTFSKEDLAEITEIVRTRSVEAASRKFCNRPYVFFDLRKIDKALNEAIEKGQELRKKNTVINQAMDLFITFDKEQFQEITKIIANGGITELRKKYHFTIYTINHCRRELPELDKAIKAGIKTRPTGAAIPSIKAKIAESKNEKKERKISKPYKTKDKTRKPPKEIINKTMNGIEDQTETVLLKFKKRMEENKKKEFVKRMRSGDFDDMIGF
jgi:hypothetical protein